MELSPFFIIFSLFLSSSPSSSATIFNTLTKGSSLSVENLDDVLISPNGIFSAGFHSVGDNAFCFAIWFTNSPGPTLVWMANRDEPVNGKGSKLSLLKTGKLILTDAGRVTFWITDTASSAASVKLDLLNNGNLVLHSLENNFTLWQSFDSPTDTLLPEQLLTRDRSLISSRSQNNFSSGFYKLYFDNDNIIRLLFNGPEISSVYWPDPCKHSWDAGRTTFNVSRIAVLNSLGNFSSSDDLTFMAADYGMGPQRRLTLDFDGNLRLYSLGETNKSWVASWQAISETCQIHGICGPNSLCSYIPESGRKCSCIPGYKIRNLTDWSYGCEPEVNISYNNSDQAGFLEFPNVDFYGYDYGFFENYTFERCKSLCLQLCECKAFLLKFSWGTPGSFYNCYPKTQLLNGFRSLSFHGLLYLKLPKASLTKYQKPIEEFRLNCSVEAHTVNLSRTYEKCQENGSLKFLLWVACSLGGVEMACILLIRIFLFRTHQDSTAVMQAYLFAATGFKKFTYAELKKATRGFREEIGRGGGGIVYRGKLSDNRVAAIKRLNEANQGEAEFLAEVSTIGRLNHMNLIEMWGYCAEGNHRLLVYEYMEHGSLADNLCSNTLNWEKRFEIALGTAKGLAYLHEECLEWVLHCDVKPQNILLDSNYNPKVADFGLSKLLNRAGLNDSSFSRIRGTRGYMAPEWVFKKPITSKVDVYSYGIVVLEMVTGKCAMMGVHAGEDGGESEQRSLVMWKREKMNEAPTKASWMEEIVDTAMEGKYDASKMEILVAVALQCVEEDRDARPSMRQVVEMLQSNEE